MIVVDTSALIGVLTGRPHVPRLIDRLSDDSDLHAPHLIDVEFIHALRRLVVSGDLSADRAEDVRLDFADLSIVRYPHPSLSDRMWELRHNVSAYDAAFVALAEALAVPLITCDARLSRAGGHRANIELFVG
ncbi:MAG: type II toxin-antitoxin system VapC family toxin [Candidatus Limnocylindrales bacterium]